MQEPGDAAPRRFGGPVDIGPMTGLGVAVTGAVGSATGHALAVNTTAPDEADVGQLGRQGSGFSAWAYFLLYTRST